MALLLGIDFGTSYFKVGLFDAGGTLRGLGRVAVGKQSPVPGRSELPVGEFWRVLRTGLAEALFQADASVRDIVGLSYSSQANTFVLLDRADQPLTPLVLWTDRRAVPLPPSWTEFAGSAAFRNSTGLGGWSGEFAPAKWRWFQQHEPECWGQTRRIMTLSDYFTQALTGEAVGDASTAALTGAYSLLDDDWWTEGLEFYGVPRPLLSQPLRPGTRVGRTVTRARDLLGLPAGVWFAVGGLDHYVAAVGSGLDCRADASISTGTVLAALRLVDDVRATTGCYHGPDYDGRFYRLSFDPAGATQLEDYRRQSAPHLGVGQLVALAGTVSRGVSADALPREDTGHRHGAAVRALMERMAATHRTLLRQLNVAPAARRVIATGGGARSAIWLQIKADVLDAPIIAPGCEEPACRGAAIFAAVAAGIYPKIPAALAAMVRDDRVVEPEPSAVAFYAEMAGRPKSA